MNALAIDTSSYQVSVCIFSGEKCLELQAEGFRSASRLASFTETALKAMKMEAKDLDIVGVGKGPGSFTGLRISASFVKGLCAGINRPLLALPSFLALALEYSSVFDYVAVVTDARRGNIYAALYKRTSSGLRALVKESLLKGEDFFKRIKKGKIKENSLVFVGEAFKFYSEIKSYFPPAKVSSVSNLPRAVFFRFSLEKALLRKRFTPLDRFEPLYLYAQDAQVKLNPKRYA
ncbi:MAG: tRNA (adenosine(37)-N6)-threonylcarbamoyltransferase complex dimerization subunit type 1 TsaB [Candidatus Omnitrophica bacterium]|nr:tRNA (adenosine(37)-N6)-threonylcarbamoyltransferase complex dimerization subunit type 1 TsaB [Candidatus Omnitrophota bacterium]